ncbi:MAG: hypothetical protein R6W31_15975 [Bacteroidales bacterium]
MMRKPILLTTMVVISTLFLNASAQSGPGAQGEKIFLAHAENCLEAIDRAAREMSVQGVAVVAYIPGDSAKSWISKMRVVGALTNGSANFLAIAYSKAAEMADTFKNSGSGARVPLHGEFGYQGGIIRKVESGYILAVFSGATGEQDAELAGMGVEWLNEYY